MLSTPLPDQCVCVRVNSDVFSVRDLFDADEDMHGC